MPRRAVATCAAFALAMVFSVQQGEHGPLVVYKLQMPKATGDAGTSRPTTAVPPAASGTVKRLPVVLTPPAAEMAIPDAAAKPPRLSPLQPSVLGTVVMPRSWPAQRTPDQQAPIQQTPEQRAPAPQATAQRTLGQPIRLLPPGLEGMAPDPSYRVVSDAPISEHMINQETGQSLTLDEVTGAVEWRQDTLERLRANPLTPRF